MKIAYLFHLNEKNGGVYRKIAYQIAAWKASGHNVIAGQSHKEGETSQQGRRETRRARTGGNGKHYL